MKKQICLLLLLVLLLPLTGCNQLNDDAAKSEKEENHTLQEEESIDIIEEDNSELDMIINNAEVYDIAWAKKEFEKNDFNFDIIIPINHMISYYQEGIGSYTFLLRGFYGNSIDRHSRIMIHTIEVSIEENYYYYQKLDGFNTMLFNIEDYGLVFEDFNHDGFIDLQLYKSMGGTMGNEPSLFWLWDNESSIFVRNAQLEEISETASIYFEPEVDSRLRSYTRGGPDEYTIGYYEYLDGNFVLNSIIYCHAEINDDETKYLITETSELINGEMQVTDVAKEKLESES